jgi:hypothetical protein
LIERNGLYYKKFTDVAFSGNVTRLIKETYEDEKQNGPYEWCHDNGQSDLWAGADRGAGGGLTGDTEGRCIAWPPSD